MRRPEAQRDSVYRATHMILRTPEGGEIPLTQAAEVRNAATQIGRKNGRRTVEVTVDVDREVANAGQVMEALSRSTLPALERRHPGLSHRPAAEQEEQAETFAALGRGMGLALLAMYALMAAAFGSYLQPLIVLSAIPFGLVGVPHWCSDRRVDSLCSPISGRMPGILLAALRSISLKVAH